MGLLVLGVSLGTGFSSTGVGVGVGAGSVVVVVVLGVSPGVVAVVVVVTVVVGASAGALDGPCACVLGSWVESVVTSVTGASTTGFATVGWGTLLAAVGAVAELDALFGAAILAFLAVRRRWSLVVAAAPNGTPTETLTGCALECTITGALTGATLAIDALATVW